MALHISQLSHRIPALAAALFLAACGSSSDTHPTTGASFASQDSFEMASAMSAGELSETRGGFLFAGGYKIDFGLTSTTSVNGVIKNYFNFSTKNLNGKLTASSLRTLIQTGNNNQAPGGSSSSNSSSTPAVNVPPTTPSSNTGSVAPSSPVPNSVTATTPSPVFTDPVTVASTPAITNAITSLVNNSSTNSVSTLIQNNLNNAVIQNHNFITLTISNFSSYRNHFAGFNNRFPSIRALR